MEERAAHASRVAAPPEVDGRTRREAWRASGLIELLERRPELAGVHPRADLAAEAVRWSV
jgi:hypothetical protein